MDNEAKISHESECWSRNVVFRRNAGVNVNRARAASRQPPEGEKQKKKRGRDAEVASLGRGREI